MNKIHDIALKAMDSKEVEQPLPLSSKEIPSGKSSLPSLISSMHAEKLMEMVSSIFGQVVDVQPHSILEQEHSFPLLVLPFLEASLAPTELVPVDAPSFSVLKKEMRTLHG
jgi:hypothetical protein